jgi:catechol 2,3-dioxygenase-like lactoylglutathione lyase family enzyme
VSSRGISEIVLIVEDVPKAADFYEHVVGLEAEHRTGDAWAWFFAGSDDRKQRLALHRGPLLYEQHSPHPEGERFGHVHFAFEVGRDELEAAVDRVRSAGVDVYGPEQLDWMKAESYYFYDPDGNLVEFWSPDRS